jgi:hypothetical protein
VNTKKTIETVVILLLSLSAVALASINIYQHVRIRQAVLTNSPPGDGSIPETAKAPLEQNNHNQIVSSGNTRTDRSEADELLDQIYAAEEELSMVNEELAADEAKKAMRNQKLKELRQKYSIKRRTNKETLKTNLEFQYADLYKKLDLSPERLDEFKDLLAEQMLARQELYADYDVTGDLTEEEQKEIGRRYGELHEEYESKIEELLGETKYAAFQTYSETQGERYRVDNYMGYLDSNDMLTETQKESLIEAMHEESKYVVNESPDYAPENYSNLSDEEKIEFRLTSYTRNNEAYLKAANSVLSAAQLEKFESHLEEETERFRLILEMQSLRDDSPIAVAVPQ